MAGVFALAALSWTLAASARADVLTLPQGKLTCSTRDIKSGEEWLAMYCGDARSPVCTLKPALLLVENGRVSIDKATQEGLRADLQELFAVEPEENVTAAPLFLAKGIAAPAFGLVSTLYQPAHGEPRPAAQGSSADIHLVTAGDAQYWIRAKFVRGERHRIDYYLEHEGRQQPLAQTWLQGDDELPAGSKLLRWAGDLDRDGKLDLLINATRHASGELDYRLFLSSLAGEGEIAGAAGAFSHWHATHPHNCRAH